VWWFSGAQCGVDHSTGFNMEKPLSRDTVFDIALLFSTVPFGHIAAVVVMPIPRGACGYPEAADVGGGPSRHDRPAADG
jgi:hypothetical protein